MNPDELWNMLNEEGSLSQDEMSSVYKALETIEDVKRNNPCSDVVKGLNVTYND